MASDITLLKKDLEALRDGNTDLDQLWICENHKEDSCKTCPLWFGQMQGGCCKSLRASAQAAGKTRERVARHRLATLADFIERRINELAG
ncbi:MAG: hypothetical protein GY934_09770 [Gammaproteobacteria bacterium]|nr:hypothetical protein [Gammaproteobacteria bacterium]